MAPLFLPVIAAVLLHSLASCAEAALITGNYQINWNQNVTKTDAGTTDVRKFKQTLDLKYRGFLSPVVQNSVTFRFEQEINSNAPDITRFLPTLDLGFKGLYWEAKTGAKRTHENSDEPGQPPKISDSYFAEFYYLAPRPVPDLKAKYTLDKDFREGTTDTSKQGIALSSVYKPTDWLDVKGDFARNTSEDRIHANNDTVEDKSRGTVDFRRIISDNIKFDAQYAWELDRGATLLTGGGETNQKKDRHQTLKTALSFRPFQDTSADGTYDVDLKQNKVNGEETLTKNAKVSVSQRIGGPFDVRGNYSRNITEARHTTDDNRKTEDTWTGIVRAKFSRQLDFSLKYERKNTDEPHFMDPTKSTNSRTITRSGAWTGELAPFWKASASADITDTFLKGVKTTVDTKYSLKSTFDFKAINLTLDPTYNLTFKEDDTQVPVLKSAVRDFKFRVVDRLLTTRTMEAKAEHTYGRKVDTAAGNIQRTDNSSANLTWKEPFPGWLFGFDLTRQATDTSGDDLPPDITTTFAFKADYKQDHLAMSTNFKYDRKSLTDNVETFDARLGWTASRWDASATYTFNRTLSAAINEGYSISLTFKYNL